MRRFLGGILGLLLLMACQGVPDGIIPRKQMVNVLTDLHLIEGYLMSMPQDSMKQVTRQYYQALYDRYETDSAGLYNSISYYSREPTVLDDIYKTVQDRLQQMEKAEQEKIDTKMRAQFVADSVRSAQIMDSTRRVAANSSRLKWAQALLLVDTAEKQVDTAAKQVATDTSARAAADSLIWSRKREQRMQRRDYLLQFLGNSRFELPFMVYDLPQEATPLPPMAPSIPVSERDKKTAPRDRQVPVEVKVKADIPPPNLRPSGPPGNARSIQRQ